MSEVYDANVTVATDQFIQFRDGVLKRNNPTLRTFQFFH